MAARRSIGAVERAYRSWVATLGALSLRQAATAAQVYALAEQVDAAKGGGVPMSAVATVSRELRIAAAELRDVAAAELRDVAALPAAAPVAKPVGDSVDQVAARRAQRRAAAGHGDG